YPEVHRGAGVNLVPLREQIVGPIRSTLLLLFAVVGFVLAVACTNIVNLLLARSVERQGEFAMRRALGASGGEVIRQSLMESVLLGLAGGVFGVALAVVGVRLLVAFQPGYIPRLEHVKVDLPVLLFSLGVSILVGLAVGLLPALNLRSAGLSELMKQGASRSTGSKGLGKVRTAVVVLEIALALVLLVAGGLTVRSLKKLLDVDPGMAPERVLAATFSLSGDRYPGPPQRKVFVDSLLAEIERSPRVQEAGIVSTLPLSRVQIDEAFAVEGRPPSPDFPDNAGVDGASEDYFRTLGVPLLSGRVFRPQDREDSPPVVVVNERLAKQAWPDESPLGKRIYVPGLGRGYREVVGVVGNIRRFGLDSEPRREIYAPYRQYFSEPIFGLVVKVKEGDPLELASEVRQAVRRVDPEQPVINLLTVQSMLDNSLSQRRFNTWVLTLAAAVALILALSGIYGVLAYYVSQRTQEMGLRIALGARPQDVLALVLRQGLTLSLIGVGLGLLVSMAASQVLQGFLYGIRSLDAVTFLTVPWIFLAVALLASLWPAWRATRTDPAVALRTE
ncbi:MAG: FtsX-like permease family protein, partial [Acidobacteria bacterium]|nr:FtsX-like permease family protein [Acidobacteriota bacterium]